MLKEKQRKNILIIGGGIAGELLVSDIVKHHPSISIIGFVDDDPTEGTVPYLGSINELPSLLRFHRPDEMVIAIPSTDGKLIRRILLHNVGNRIPITIVPREQVILHTNNVRYDQVRSVTVDDFLGRPFMKKSVSGLVGFYENKTVFVTGGAGSIGSEIVRQLLDLNAKKVIIYDNSEYLLFLLEQQLRERGLLSRCELVIGSITNTKKLHALFLRIRPDIVFHAAAYKHVHLMQDNVDEAISNNVIGTKRVIDAALASGVSLFTFISTDKVVNPTSVMGATKKLCEYYVQSLAGKNMKFNIVRFGNVINSSGSALPLFERQIALHKYVTVTHRDMERFFMSIREAAQLVVESTAFGKANTIHILNMGELINVYKIALSLIRSKNLIPHEDVEIRITGLREGEKMIEELYTDDEERNLEETDLEGVFSLKNYEKCHIDIAKVLDDLERMLGAGSGQENLKDYLKQTFLSLV